MRTAIQRVAAAAVVIGAFACASGSARAQVFVSTPGFALGLGGAPVVAPYPVYAPYPAYGYPPFYGGGFVARPVPYWYGPRPLYGPRFYGPRPYGYGYRRW
jgi:hypothetical protein